MCKVFGWGSVLAEDLAKAEGPRSSDPQKMSSPAAVPVRGYSALNSMKMMLSDRDLQSARRQSAIIDVCHGSNLQLLPSMPRERHVVRLTALLIPTSVADQAEGETK